METSTDVIVKPHFYCMKEAIMKFSPVGPPSEYSLCRVTFSLLNKLGVQEGNIEMHTGKN